MFFCHSWFDTNSLIEFRFGLYFRPNQIDMQLILNNFDDPLNWILFGPSKLTYYLFGHNDAWTDDISSTPSIILNQHIFCRVWNYNYYLIVSIEEIIYCFYCHHSSFTTDPGSPISAFLKDSRKLRNFLGTIGPGPWLQGSLFVSLKKTLPLYMLLPIIIYKWFQW